MATSLELNMPSDPCPMPTMSSDDEDSFVVLGKSLIPDVDLTFNNLSIEPIQTGPIEEGKALLNMEVSQLETSVLPQMPDMLEQGIDSTISVTTISSELSPEEIQEKVDTLISENIKLRETIIKNNMAMESQHERIVAWKGDVQKTHEAHKLKFAEAKEFIAKLKADKELLTLELDKSNEIRDLQQSELFRLKDQLKMKETKETATDNRSNSLEIDWDSQYSRMLQLKSQLEESSAENALKNELLQTAKDRIIELESQLKKAIEDRVTKDEQLEIAEIKIMSLERLLESNQLIQKRLSRDIQEFQSSKLAMTEEIRETFLNVMEKKDKTIEELACKLENNELSTNTTIKNLNADILNLRSQLCLTMNLQEDLDNARKQLMGSQASITGLQQSNAALTAQLTAEQEKVKEIESMKAQCFALEQQVEVNKVDFETERLTKEKLRTEKDQIISDLLELQKRNNELNEEMELMRERGFAIINHSRDHNSSNSSSSSAASPEGLKADKELPMLELDKLNEMKELQQSELFRKFLRRDWDCQYNMLLQLESQLDRTAEENAIKSKDRIIELESQLKNDVEDANFEITKCTITRLKGLLETKNRFFKEKREARFRRLISTIKIIEKFRDKLEKKNRTIAELFCKLRDKELSKNMIIKNLNTDLRSQLWLSMSLQKELGNARKQLLRVLASITDLQESNADLKAQLAAEEEKVQEIKLMKAQCFALKHQVEAYKVDCENQQLTIEKLRAEKDDIMGDLRKVEKQNIGLLVEIDKMRERSFEINNHSRDHRLVDEIDLIERGFEIINHSRDHNSNSSSSSAASPEARRYDCSNCILGFTSSEDLEVHVKNCTNIRMIWQRPYLP